MRLNYSLALLTLLPFVANAADVTGTWTATFDTEVGKQSYTYEFKVEGTELSGKAISANGEVAIEEGAVHGETIYFVEKLVFRGMPLTITYTGTMNGADEIQFAREISGFGVERLVARREN